jgi:hypothetical protein
VSDFTESQNIFNVGQTKMLFRKINIKGHANRVGDVVSEIEQVDVLILVAALTLSLSVII